MRISDAHRDSKHQRRKRKGKKKRNASYGFYVSPEGGNFVMALKRTVR